MNYLSVSELSKSFGEFKLFKNVSFGLEKGQKVGLVAKNGAGKSTLFKILMEKEIQDDGKVTYREGIRIGWLEQEPSFGDAETIDDYIQKECSKNKVLDFEGSNIKGVKRFYKGFGASERNYIYIQK